MWWYFLLLVSLAVMIWLIYEWFQHTFVQYNTTAVEFQKLCNQKELKICLISDLHNNKKRVSSLTKKISDFGPDFILLAGDMVNKHKEKNAQAEVFLQALQELSVPVFYSAGNHELSLSEKFPSEWTQFLQNLPVGITYLDNTSILLNSDNRICISGLSLPRCFYKKGALHDTAADLPKIKIPENDFHILLAHHPEYAKLYTKYQPDLIVSGHLHGGLLRLPGIGGVVSPRLRLPDCDAGIIPLSNNTKMFISRGLGSHTIPLRFFNRVEVNFLVLKGN